MDTAALIAKLLACVAALQSGNPLGCAAALAEVLDRVREWEDSQRQPGWPGGYEETYIWDQPFGGEPECRPFE